jgi:hypothetical protein
MIKLKISKIKNLTIKITISDNEKEIKATSINVEDYQKIKDLHGISLVDEMISELLSTIQPKNN